MIIILFEMANGEITLFLTCQICFSKFSKTNRRTNIQNLKFTTMSLATKCCYVLDMRYFRQFWSNVVFAISPYLLAHVIKSPLGHVHKSQDLTGTNVQRCRLLTLLTDTCTRSSGVKVHSVNFVQVELKVTAAATYQFGSPGPWAVLGRLEVFPVVFPVT